MDKFIVNGPSKLKGEIAIFAPFSFPLEFACM